MTRQTFYRRLRQEDPKRWKLNEGAFRHWSHIRRDDGCCPLGAMPESRKSLPHWSDAVLDLQMTEQYARSITWAADYAPRDLSANDRRIRAAILRNLGIEEVS